LKVILLDWITWNDVWLETRGGVRIDYEPKWNRKSEIYFYGVQAGQDVRAVVRKKDQTVFKSDFKFLENGKSIEIQVKH